MNNKILIKVIVPELSSSYDVFIPFNEVVWKINKMITKVVFDLQEIKIDIRKANYMLINKNSGRVYNNNEIIIDTDIRNGSELVLLPIKKKVDKD